MDLWFFDLAKAEPLRFTGKGSADVTPNDAGGVTGVASYDQGEWSVIFKRPRRPDAGAAFAPGAFLPIAFSVWDGFSRERGNRRGLSLWYSLYLEPENVPSPIGPDDHDGARHPRHRAGDRRVGAAFPFPSARGSRRRADAAAGRKRVS